MTISELIAYAEQRFQIREQHKWADLPGFSVLCHPRTGKWVALLMRQWDGELGEIVERCDLKCGRECLWNSSSPFLSMPYRMNGLRWVGVKFGPQTEKAVVLKLFEQALRNGEPDSGYTIVLGSQNPTTQNVCQDTPITFGCVNDDPSVPEPIRRMMRLYEYGDGSAKQRRLNFYRQGKLMEKYEDAAPWEGEFKRYFTTYHDLNVRQLRGYFTWRTHLRSGKWHGITASLAYIYLYELLNGIGTTSAEDSLAKMLEFERQYLDAGFGDDAMRSNLRRWMLEFAVLNSIPKETAATCADQNLMQMDKAIASLHHPMECNDEDILMALCLFADKKVTFALPEHGLHLVAETWRYAQQHYNEGGMDLFTVCFGEPRQYVWYPLSNAVYHRLQPDKDTDYSLNECRSFLCRDGIWYERRYEKLYFNLVFLRELLHQIDVSLRRYLKTGHYLREKPHEAWARPYVEAVIADDKRRQTEAARPKIDIHLERLAHIREDALKTRDSLLTEEEMCGTDETEELTMTENTEPSATLPAETQILQMLLKGESPDEFIKSSRLMPSVVADTINETYFDDIGDNIVQCNGSSLSLMEEYIEEIKQIISGEMK